MLLSLVTLGILIYSNILEVPFYFDDGYNIEQNPNIRLTKLSFEELTRAAFKSPMSNRPIANLSFALNYYFHQYDVIGYHVVNIIIHITTGILLYFFLKTTLSLPPLSSRYKPDSSIAFYTALIWLVHPIQSQSVTYVVQRMNSVAAMFYILSFLLYTKARLVRNNEKSWPWFAGCTLAGILAVGSKETAASLPFFIIVYEWYFFQDLSKAWLKRHLVSLAGILILFVLLAFVYMGANPLEAIFSTYEYRNFTLTERVLTEFRVVIHYISLLLYPHPSRLVLLHDFELSQSLLDPLTTSLSIGAIIGLIGLAFYTARKERLISFCILWFFGNLVIESSVIGLEIIYEHRTYLPSMFLFLIITILAHRHIKRDLLKAGGLATAILLLSLWTYERNSLWNDPVTFWNDVVRKSPCNARAYNNLGTSYMENRSYRLALMKLKDAIQLNPNLIEAQINMGVTLAAQSKLDEAITHYYAALQVKPKFAKPHEFAGAHFNLGNALARQGKLDKAIAHYSEALRIKPDDAEAHNNLGIALAAQEMTSDAVAHFREALRVRPDFAEARHNLAVALQEAGTPVNVSY
jgi:tetratricopeptide (TPR) repeat protein